MKNNLLVILLVAVVLGGGYWWFTSDRDTETPNDDNTNGNDSPILDDQPEAAEIRNLIVVDRPLIGEQVSSPLTVIGEARGTWYFEATAPMRLEDANGNILAQHYITAQGEWMTEDYVPFEGTIMFTSPQTSTGTLVLEKSNPSGLDENANELRIPVVFR